MGNTIGYIGGALSALALAAGIGYAVDNPRFAKDSTVKDAKNSIILTLQSPKGNIGEGNTLEVIADAAHDLGQGNLSRAWQTLGRIDMGFENTPLQDQRLRSSNYKHTQDFGRYVKKELGKSHILADYSPKGLNTNGELLLGIAGLGLGILIAVEATSKP